MNKIYQARTGLGLSRGYVAKAVGLSEEELQQVEEGSIGPSESLLTRLSGLFHLPVEYFTDEAFPDGQNGFSGEDNITEHDRQEIENLQHFKKNLSAAEAMKIFQQQMRGAAGKAGFKSEEDVADWITAGRRNE